MQKARLRQKHGPVLQVLTDAMEIGDPIFDACTASENVDGAGEGQVKEKPFGQRFTSDPSKHFLTETGF